MLIYNITEVWEVLFRRVQLLFTYVTTSYHIKFKRKTLWKPFLQLLEAWKCKDNKQANWTHLALCTDCRFGSLSVWSAHCPQYSYNWVRYFRNDVNFFAVIKAVLAKVFFMSIMGINYFLHQKAKDGYNLFLLFQYFFTCKASFWRRDGFFFLEAFTFHCHPSSSRAKSLRYSWTKQKSISNVITNFRYLKANHDVEKLHAMPTIWSWVWFMPTLDLEKTHNNPIRKAADKSWLFLTMRIFYLNENSDSGDVLVLF